MRASPPLEKRRRITRENLVGRRARLRQGALQGLLFRSLFREPGDAKTLLTVPGGAEKSVTGQQKGIGRPSNTRKSYVAIRK